MSNSHIRDAVSAGAQSLVMADSVELCEELASTFGVLTNQMIAIADKMSVATVLDSKGHFMMICRDDFGDPLFGKILNVVSLSDDGM